MNIAVFASGNGSNFQAIIDAANKLLPVKLKLLVCDNPKAYVLKRAQNAAVKTYLICRNNFDTRAEFEADITCALRREKIDLVVLAGFMRILSEEFVKKFEHKIMNIHPSLLPAFKGSNAIRDAMEYGVKVTGVTVHFVDKDMDHGPIILQKAVNIVESDTQDSLAEKIHKVEHQLYPLAIKLFARGKLKVSGRTVQILD
jgi:phosphoribosylglycinamide formyltransferase-1